MDEGTDERVGTDEKMMLIGLMNEGQRWEQNTPDPPDPPVPPSLTPFVSAAPRPTGRT